MGLRISALIDHKRISFSLDHLSEIKELAMYAQIMKFPDKICEIAITKEYLIVTTELPGTWGDISKHAAHSNQAITNINAYDWKGNRVWNISDIVGNIRSPFSGGTVTTKGLIVGHAGVNEAMINDSHELFVCTTMDDFLYIIDLTEKKLIQKVQTK